METDRHGRRRLVRMLGAPAAAAATGCTLPMPLPAVAPARPRARVVVVGGGWAGATAASELKRLADSRIEVILVARTAASVSGPQSSLLLSGRVRLQDLSRDYRALRERGVQVLNDEVVDIDVRNRSVALRKVAGLRADLLVLAPGVQSVTDAVAGLDAATVGVVTDTPGEVAALRDRLESMPDGSTYLVAVPTAPFTGPAAPYERACIAAGWLRRARPRARVVVLDANPEPAALPDGFVEVWQTVLRGRVDYRPQSPVVAVEPRTRTVVTAAGDRWRADALDLVLPQRAPDLLRRAGLMPSRAPWVRVDGATLAVPGVPGVHVIGDATEAHAGTTKSAPVAVAHGRICAAAIVASLDERTAAPIELVDETVAFIDERRAMQSTVQLRWSGARRAFVPASEPAGDAEPVDARVAQRRMQVAWDTLMGPPDGRHPPA